MMKVEVILTDRTRITVEVESYNAREVLEALNDPAGDRYILIGNDIFDRTTVSRVVPVREQ